MDYTEIQKIVRDPEVYSIGTLPQYSDHKTVTEDMVTSYSLNGTWKFSYAENNEKRIHSFSEKDFDDQLFDDVVVPNHIDLNGYGQINYVDRQILWHTQEKLPFPEIPSQLEYGQYIKKFRLPKDWHGRTVHIEFGGVEVAFSLWCNGHFVGYAEDSFAPSSFDLTPFVSYEGENRIAVEVYRFTSASYLEHQGFWRFWGIHKAVALKSYPDAYLQDVEVTTDLADTFEKAVIEAEVTVAKEEDLQVSLNYELYDGDHCLYSGEQSKIKVENPKLWSSEVPNLYRLKITLSGDGRVLQSTEVAVGIRKIVIEDGIMKLNGERLLFRGVNRHDFNQHRGRVVTKEEVEEEIRFLKRNNFNALRTSHYPNETYVYELCDQYGLYVIDETNIETHGTWLYDTDNPLAIPGDKDEWKETVIDRCRTMIERDKNHVSILMWSLGNESYGGRVFMEMAEYIRDRDSSRLIHYEGLFNDRSYNDSSDVESQMYSTPQDNIKFLEENLDKPLMHCEYIHAMGNSGGAIYKYKENEANYPHYQGGFVWVLKEPPLFRDGKYQWGGQVDSRPSDYEFILVGIITADNQETPMVSELRKFNEFIDFELDGTNGIKVTNNYLFHDLTAYEFEVVYSQEGVQIHRTEHRLSTKPKASDVLPLAAEILSGNYGEIQIDVAAKKREGDLWCEPGHVIAREQFTYETNPVEALESLHVHTAPRLIESDYNIGVVGDSFSLQIARKTCKLTSLKYHGIEYIDDIDESLSPNFWRPLTLNDRSVRAQMPIAQWKTASLYQCAEIVKAYVRDKQVVIETKVVLATTPESHVTVDYIVSGDGKIQVVQSTDGFADMPDLMCYGMTLRIPKRFSAVNWFGRGPEDTHIDRYRGNFIGKYSMPVVGQFQYLFSQEYGNKTDVRWFEVHNNFGNGLKFSSTSPFEFSVRPHSITEIEHYRNTQNLPETLATYVQVNQVQAGIGGYDSWFNWCEEEYRLKADRKRRFEFTIEPLND